MIVSDSGFAPNPFEGFCTLANCKPGIRYAVEVGDWVIATGTDRTVGINGLVYAMCVREKLNHDLYYRDLRFSGKKVSDPDNPPSCAGDNMYFLDEARRWKRDPLSFRHAEAWRVRKDLAGKFVLVSDEFYYFGKLAPMMPGFLQYLVHPIPDGFAVYGHSHAKRFVEWIKEWSRPGIHSEPWEWITKSIYGRISETLPEDLVETDAI
jgi:hypothetical protein